MTFDPISSRSSPSSISVSVYSLKSLSRVFVLPSGFHRRGHVSLHGRRVQLEQHPRLPLLRGQLGLLRREPSRARILQASLVSNAAFLRATCRPCELANRQLDEQRRLVEEQFEGRMFFEGGLRPSCSPDGFYSKVQRKSMPEGECILGPIRSARQYHDVLLRQRRRAHRGVQGQTGQRGGQEDGLRMRVHEKVIALKRFIRKVMLLLSPDHGARG